MSVDVERLREAVWSAQHDTTCDEQPAHSWSDHLPWDDADTERAAIEEADAIVAALRPVVLAQAEAEREGLRRIVEVWSHQFDGFYGTSRRPDENGDRSAHSRWYRRLSDAVAEARAALKAAR